MVEQAPVEEGVKSARRAVELLETFAADPAWASLADLTLPAHATALGKALLAELTDAEVSGLLPTRLAALTGHTRTSRAKLLTELGRVRTDGYATEREEGTPGVACAAAAVPYRIPATDALSCSMPAERADAAEARRVGELLAGVAADLGRRLRRRASGEKGDRGWLTNGC